MANKTGIAWTDLTWNPTTGCTKVSAGCKHCYAERIFQRPYPGRAFTDVRTHPDRLDQPLRIRKPQRIFVNSMSDLFHEDVPFEFIDKVLAVTEGAAQHTFQILTKRPARMSQYFAESRKEWWPLPNVWLGVSCEDQETADERIPLLLQTAAAVRFVSYEPALGPVDFRNLPIGDHHKTLRLPPGHDRFDSLNPHFGVQWVIVGGESGPSARPFNIDWARSTIAQCKAAGVSCFVKQLGAKPHDTTRNAGLAPGVSSDKWNVRWQIKDRTGADITEWPDDIKLREFPA